MSELRADDQAETTVTRPWTAKLAAACGVICALALVLAGAVAVLLTVGREQNVDQPEAWITASVMAVIYSAMMFAAALMIHRRTTPLLQYPVLLMAPAACSILLVTIVWNESMSWETVDMLFGMAACLTILSFAILLTGGLALLRSPGAVVRFGRMASWGSLWVTAFGGVLLIFEEIIFSPITGPALYGLLAMTTGLGVPVTVVLLLVTYVGYRIHSNRRPESETLLRSFVVALVCPRCETEVKLKPGESLCPGCRILMRLQVDEPKCECGYQLYKLKGDHCPECGRSIREDQRWPKPETDAIEAPASDATPPPAPEEGRPDGELPVEPVSSDDPDRSRPSPPARE